VIELILILFLIIIYFMAYMSSLYSLAVYIDPDDIDTLLSDVSKIKRDFLRRLADDPQGFMQIAKVFKSFVLILSTAITYWISSRHIMHSDINVYVQLAIALLVVWMIYLFFVEYLPRRKSRLAINDKMTRHLWLISIVYFSFYPLVSGLRNLLKKISIDTKVTEEEKEEIVERAIETLADQAGINETLVEEDEIEMIGQIFQLDQTVVREIMVPRIQVTAIEKGMSFKDIRSLVLKDGHSRYPVYDDTIDNIIGLIYVKDLFNSLPEPGEKFVMKKFLRKPYFVPETKIIGKLLSEFKSKRLHIAMVVDEYGGVAGLVTLEDIIEEIFGEIRDEHDWEQDEFASMTDGTYLVDGKLLVEDLQEKLNTNYEQGDYDTVGGLIYHLVGSVPKVSQKIKWHDIEFEVSKIEGQRIVSVKVRQ